MDRHEKWLLELTGLPTAAGREDRVVAWLTAWARRRRSCRIRADPFGNLVITRHAAAGPAGRSSPRPRPPLYFTAHLDHPAFVVREILDHRRIVAEFRGGVRPEYFEGTEVLLHHDGRAPQRGRVRAVEHGGDGRDLAAEIEMHRALPEGGAAPSDVVTWSIGPPRIRAGRLHAPACDNLAGVAAALSAFDRLARAPARRGRDVGLLLTRCEEVGFVGAIGACEGRTVPKAARLIVLENSKSFPESPIGAGPIVRVGDRTSTFDPDLTHRLSRIAEDLEKTDASFRWQRKLMPGGTCEASAYQAFGYRAACVCLPLGNYHNMDEGAKRIAAETISLDDYHHLVRLLEAAARRIDDGTTDLRGRLERLFVHRRALLLSEGDDRGE